MDEREATAPVPTPCGLLVIDKPLGRSSMDVCRVVRRRLINGGAPKRVKVGHGGTLDPLATGVLVVMVGKATGLCERVMADPGTPHTFDELAHAVGASTRTLARRFRDELGVSFSQWRQQAVLASAIPLMSQGMPLARVAQELGYNSQSAFSAMFRRAFGQSPSAFLHRPGADEMSARDAA